jgi:hypothetical protein
MRQRHQFGHPRPCIGEPQPRRQPGGERLRIDRDKDDGALVFFGQRQWRVGRRLL